MWSLERVLGGAGLVWWSGLGVGRGVGAVPPVAVATGMAVALARRVSAKGVVVSPRQAAREPRGRQPCSPARTTVIGLPTSQAAHPARIPRSASRRLAGDGGRVAAYPCLLREKPSGRRGGGAARWEDAPALRVCLPLPSFGGRPPGAALGGLGAASPGRQTWPPALTASPSHRPA